jgi:hypothetical protein
VAEALAGYANGAAAAGGSTFQGPGGILSSRLPTGIAQTISCSQLAAGGTGTITFDFPLVASLQGQTISYTYNNCSYSGYTFNGTFALTYDRYTSPTDFTYTATWTNFTVSGGGVATQSYSGKQTCTLAGGAAVSCFYSDTTGRSWSGTVSYTGGILNGTYTANYGSGVVTIKYTNFGVNGGTAEFTGANGTKVVITRNSATKFTVVITANGVTTTYVYGS